MAPEPSLPSGSPVEGQPPPWRHDRNSVEEPPIYFESRNDPVRTGGPRRILPGPVGPWFLSSGPGQFRRAKQNELQPGAVVTRGSATALEQNGRTVRPTVTAYRCNGVPQPETPDWTRTSRPATPRWWRDGTVCSAPGVIEGAAGDGSARFPRAAASRSGVVDLSELRAVHLPRSSGLSGRPPVSTATLRGSSLARVSPRRKKWRTTPSLGATWIGLDRVRYLKQVRYLEGMQYLERIRYLNRSVQDRERYVPRYILKPDNTGWNEPGHREELLINSSVAGPCIPIFLLFRRIIALYSPKYRGIRCILVFDIRSGDHCRDRD